MAKFHIIGNMIQSMYNFFLTIVIFKLDTVIILLELSSAKKRSTFEYCYHRCI